MENLSEFASAIQASIHMPKIGTGKGGGDWKIIQALIVSALNANRLQVYVYDHKQ